MYWLCNFITTLDDNILIDEMMTVLKETIKSANTLLLVLKGTETRIDAAMQQMLREMKALFGDEMWNHVVVGVSFWSFSAAAVDARNRFIRVKLSFVWLFKWHPKHVWEKQ